MRDAKQGIHTTHEGLASKERFLAVLDACARRDYRHVEELWDSRPRIAYREGDPEFEFLIDKSLLVACRIALLLELVSADLLWARRLRDSKRVVLGFAIKMAEAAFSMGWHEGAEKGHTAEPEVEFHGVRSALRRVMASELRQAAEELSASRGAATGTLRALDRLCKEEIGASAEILIGAWIPSAQSALELMRREPKSEAQEADDFEAAVQDMLNGLWSVRGGHSMSYR